MGGGRRCGCGAGAARGCGGVDVAAACGMCRFCIRGEPVLCERGRVQAESGGLPNDGTTRLRLDGQTVHHLMGVSCLAEQVVVPEMSVVRIPERVPSAVAAITGCTVITGVGAVLNVAGAVAGSSMLVIGAGGVGLSALMGAELAGVHPIIVADVEPLRLERARHLGATDVIDAGSHDMVEAAMDLLPGGVDWALDAVRRPETLQQSIACLRPGGTAIAVGLAGSVRSPTCPSTGRATSEAVSGQPLRLGESTDRSSPPVRVVSVRAPRPRRAGGNAVSAGCSERGICGTRA